MTVRHFLVKTTQRGHANLLKSLVMSRSDLQRTHPTLESEPSGDEPVTGEELDALRQSRNDDGHA